MACWMRKKEFRSDPPDLRPSPLELLAQHEQAERISAALVGIAAEYREAIVLRSAGRSGAGRNPSRDRRRPWAPSNRGSIAG